MRRGVGHRDELAEHLHPLRRPHRAAAHGQRQRVELGGRGLEPLHERRPALGRQRPQRGVEVGQAGVVGRVDDEAEPGGAALRAGRAPGPLQRAVGRTGHLGGRDADEVAEQPRGVPRLDQRQSPVEGGQQPVALLGAHRQRRLDPDHPVAEQRRGDPDALDLQQVAGHRQREVAAVGQGADQTLVPGHVEGVRQLETQEQPAAADVGDHPGVPAGQGLQTVAQLGTAGPHPGQQPVGGEPVEGGQPDPAGQRAAGERRGVPQGEGLGGQRGPAEHRADRHQPATQRLGQGEHVGGHAVRGAPEELAGAAQAGLHLVEDQDCAVLVAQRPQSRPGSRAGPRGRRPRPGSAPPRRPRRRPRPPPSGRAWRPGRRRAPSRSRRRGHRSRPGSPAGRWPTARPGSCRGSPWWWPAPAAGRWPTGRS